MKVYSIVAVLITVVLIYFISALVPLPWYLYLPFVAIFLLVYYWDRVVRRFPSLGRFNRWRNPRRNQCRPAARGRRGRRI